MTDSLRDALEKLVQEWQYTGEPVDMTRTDTVMDDCADELKRVLAVRPAEPVGVCTCPPHANPEYSTPGDWDPACPVHQPVGVSDEARTSGLIDCGGTGHEFEAEVADCRTCGSVGVSDEAVKRAHAAGLAALEADKDWHKPDSMGVWRANYTRAVELVLEAAAPYMGATPVASRERATEALHRERHFGRKCDQVDLRECLLYREAWRDVDVLLAAGVFRDEAEVKAQVAKHFRQDAIDEAVDGKLNLTAVIRMADEARRV